jgi:hypothetical protein
LALIVDLLELDRWNVSDRTEQPTVVEPFNPRQRRELDLLDVPPRSLAANELGLVETADRLDQGAVVRVADAADRGLDARLGEPLRVADRDVLLGRRRP